MGPSKELGLLAVLLSCFTLMLRPQEETLALRAKDKAKLLSPSRIVVNKWILCLVNQIKKLAVEAQHPYA